MAMVHMITQPVSASGEGQLRRASEGVEYPSFGGLVRPLTGLAVYAARNPHGRNGNGGRCGDRQHWQ
jgi:hypothetical protein